MILLKNKLTNYFFYLLLLFIFSLINFSLYNHTFKNIKLDNKSYNKSEEDKKNNLDYNKNKFAIIKRNDCPICGLFSYYIIYLGCTNPL